MKYLVFFLSLLFGYFILFICIVNWYNPFYTDLGNGYFVSSDKDYGTTDLVYEYAENDRQNRNICRYDSLGHKDTLIISPETRGKVIVGMHIEDIEDDSEHIVLQRKPKDVFDSLYISALESDSLAFHGFNSDYDYSFKHFFNTFEYWIIDKQTNDVYGPLSLTQYNSKRKQLGVSETLRLDFEDDRLETNDTIFLILFWLVILSPFFFALLITIIFCKYRAKIS